VSKQKKGTPDAPGTARLKVDGEEIVFNSDTLLYHPERVETDTVTIASAINLWGQHLAKAEEQKLMVDAEYRDWRAKQTNDLLAKDPKLSEWKAKAKIEAMERFLLFKTGIATAERNVHALRAVGDALRAKLQVLLVAMAGQTAKPIQRP
jgi:hypothetical protein